MAGRPDCVPRGPNRPRPYLIACGLIGEPTPPVIANGGATILLQTLRQNLDRSAEPQVDDFEVERITRTRQIVTERTGTEG